MLGHLLIKFQTLIAFAHVKSTHALMCWNPLALGIENHPQNPDIVVYMLIVQSDGFYTMYLKTRI